jgi:hypothetical protein
LFIVDSFSRKEKTMVNGRPNISIEALRARNRAQMTLHGMSADDKVVVRGVLEDYGVDVPELGNAQQWLLISTPAQDWTKILEAIKEALASTRAEPQSVPALV